MFALFYSANGTAPHPRELDGMSEKEIVKAIIGKHDYRLYDLSTDQPTSKCINAREFEDDYNNEELDGGFWLRMLPTITYDEIIEATNKD